MENLLPPLFIAISALALCLAIFAVWSSLRGLFARDHGLSGDSRKSERARLVDEKMALLQTLKDIRFERELGKISEQDFDALNARYRARAKQVLRKLDEQLGPYRGEAEALVDAVAKGELAQPAEPDPGTPGKSQPKPKTQGVKGAEGEAAPADAPADAPKVCASCETENDADAQFCKACGQRLGAGPEGTDGAGEARA